MNKKFLILILAGAVIVLGGVAAFAPASPFKLNLNQFALRGSVKNPVSASSTSAVPLYKPVIDYEQAVINAVEKLRQPLFLLLFPRTCRLLKIVLIILFLIYLRISSNFLTIGFNFPSLAKKGLSLKRLAVAADSLSPKTD